MSTTDTPPHAPPGRPAAEVAAAAAGPAAPAGAPGATPPTPGQGSAGQGSAGQGSAGQGSGGVNAPVLAVLALLTAIAPLAIDMYLPAFPQIAAEFGVSASLIQFSLTTFLLGLAVGQLVIGPLSDQRGRRTLLIAGTAVGLLGGAACALAPSAEVLVAARFVQGFGGAAGIVLSRAVIADRTTGTRSAELFGVMMVIQGVAPVAAPLLGGGLIGLVGWRGVFWVVTALSAVMLVGVLAAIPETLPPAARRTGGLRTLGRDVARIVRQRRYVGYALSFALAFAVMFAYISASPFVLQNVLGLSVGTYSLAFAVNALGLVAGSAVSAKLVARTGPEVLLRGGLGVLAAASVLVLVDVTVLGTPLWPTLVLLFVAVTSLGFVLGNAGSLATGEVAAVAGTGSALMGAVQFGLGGLASPLVGLRGEEDPLPMAVAMVVASVLALLALTWGSRGRSRA